MKALSIGGATQTGLLKRRAIDKQLTASLEIENSNVGALNGRRRRHVHSNLLAQ